MVPACIILLAAPLYGIAKRFEHLRRKALCKHKVSFISCLFEFIINNKQIEIDRGIVWLFLQTCDLCFRTVAFYIIKYRISVFYQTEH